MAKFIDITGMFASKDKEKTFYGCARDQIVIEPGDRLVFSTNKFYTEGSNKPKYTLTLIKEDGSNVKKESKQRQQSEPELEQSEEDIGF